MANIYDVARRAQVSTATVSKVLSNTPYVSTQTRERVLEAVRELQYTPSLAARGLTRNRTFVMGLVIPYDPDYLFSDPFLLEVIRGVEQTANDHDYNVLLSMAKKNDQRSAYTRLLRSGYIDGAVTVETFEGDVIGRQLEERGVPRVSIGYSDSSRPLNTVHSDDYRGAYEAVNYLLELGHRRVGIVSGPAQFMGAMDERLRGARDALTVYNLKPDPSLLTFGDFTVESGYRACQPLLQIQPRPTALFVMNDRMATGVLRYARGIGLQVPRDLSVVGFDDVLLSASVEPPLTTIRQHSVELGQVATQQLFELINRTQPHFEPIILPVELVIRGTTVPPSF